MFILIYYVRTSERKVEACFRCVSLSSGAWCIYACNQLALDLNGSSICSGTLLLGSIRTLRMSALYARDACPSRREVKSPAAMMPLASAPV